MAKLKNTQCWLETGGKYAKDLDKRMKVGGLNPYTYQVDYVLKDLEDIKFDSMLEVGANNGRMIGPISKKWPDKEYVALDINRPSLNILKRRYPKIKTRTFNAAVRLPYDDNKFDLVFTSECLCHIAIGDIDNLRNEIKRVAKRCVFLSEPFRTIYPDRHTVNVTEGSHYGTFMHHHEKYFDNCEVKYYEDIRVKNYIIKL